jgi:hypothetical protein
MADNTVLSPGAGGDTVATEDIGGVKYQLIKPVFGAAGAATKVSASDPLPVTVISSALPTGAATEATLSALAGDLGDTTDAAAAGDGSLIAITKQNRAHLVTLAGAVSGTEVQADIVAALPAGTNNIGDVDVLTMPGVVGTIADDATTPGAPVMVGGTAKSPDGTDPGNVSAEDDVVRLITDLNRRLMVGTRHPFSWSYHEDSSSALTDAEVKAAPGAGYQIVLTEIIVSIGAATAFNFFLEEGASKIFGPHYLEAVNGRGFFWQGEKKVTANTAVTVTTSAAIAHGIDIQGYIQKV